MLQNSGFVGGVTSSASQDKRIMIQDVHHGRALKRVWATPAIAQQLL